MKNCYLADAIMGMDQFDVDTSPESVVIEDKGKGENMSKSTWVNRLQIKKNFTHLSVLLHLVMVNTKRTRIMSLSRALAHYLHVCVIW